MNAFRSFPGSIRLGLTAVAVSCLLLTGTLLVSPVAGADPSTSCDNDPCTNLPYSFAVTVNGMVIPHMDTNVFGDYLADEGAPLLQTTPETYVTNTDGSVTGTVTAAVTVGLAVSQPLLNDVTVYFESGMPQDGTNCDTPCDPVVSDPCTLSAGQTSTTCSFPDWWQAFSSVLPEGTGTDYNIIYTDPGQWDMVDANGHPYTYGFGFAALTAFVPTAPGSAPSAQPAAQPESRSFTVRYRPVVGGNFTLNVKRGTSVISHRFLGWQKPGAHSTTFSCGTRRGHLTLVVIGVRTGKTQRSNPKPVTC